MNLLGAGQIRLIGSLEYGPAASPFDLGQVRIEDFLLHEGTRALVQGVGNILESTIFTPFARHGDEQAGGPADDLQIANDEAIIQHNGDVGLELVFVDRKNFDFGDVHSCFLLVLARCDCAFTRSLEEPLSEINLCETSWNNLTDLCHVN